MKKYEKPVLEETKIIVEGVFAGSGEEESENGGNNTSGVFCERDKANGKYRPHSNHCTGCSHNINNIYCDAGRTF